MRENYMKNISGDRFDGRLNTGSQAKQRQLERFREAAADPETLAKRADRQVAAEAREGQREAKAAERLKEKEEAKRQKAEAAALDAAKAMTREVELGAEGAETAEPKPALVKASEAELKAERDRRYAARRNRKR